MELLRILKNRKIMTGFLLLLLVAAGIYYYEETETARRLEERKAVMDEKLAAEMEIFRPYEERQIAYTAGYTEGINRILDTADSVAGISIFQKGDTFSSQNIIQTREAYKRVESVEAFPGNYEALEQVLSYDLTGYLIFLFSLVLIWDFTEEKNTGLGRIIYSTPGGRARLAFRQLGILTFLTSLFAAGAYGVTFVVSAFLYGMPGSWNVSAQSMILLGRFPWPVSILEYLVFFLSLRILFAAASALFAWMLAEIFRSRVPGLLTVILVYGGEGILYTVLSDTSPISFLRYLNVFALLSPGDILYEYRNFNLDGTPVNCLAALILVAVLTLLFSSLVILVIAEQRKPVYTPGRIEEGFRRAWGQLGEWIHRGVARLSVPGLEGYKVFVLNRGWVFILLWLVVFLSQIDLTKITFTGKSLLLQEIYEEYAGPDDGSLRVYLDEQEAVIAEVKSEYEAKIAAYEAGELGEEEFTAAAEIYSSYGILISTVEDLRSQLQYVEEQSTDAWIVNEKPYRILWTENGIYQDQGYRDQEIDGILSLILVILLVSGMFSYDRLCGIRPVIRCTEKGRMWLFLTRTFMAFLISFAVCAVTTGIRLMEVNVNYPLDSLIAPVQSLRFLSKFPLPLSIGGFLIMLFVIRTLVLTAEGMMVMTVTERLSGTKGLGVSAGILLIPQVVYMLGFDWGWYGSAVQPLIYVEILNQYGAAVSMIVVVLVLLAGSLCGWILMKRWCGKRGRYGIKNKKPVKKVS